MNQEQKQIQYLLEKIRNIEGQLAASQIAVRALLLTHPDRIAATETMTRELDRWATAYTYSQAADVTIDGFAAARKKLFPSAADQERYP